MKLPRHFLLLVALVVGLLGAGGCASVQAGRLLQAEPYHVYSPTVFGVPAHFPGWPESSSIPLKLGKMITAELSARGLNAEFQEGTAADVAEALQRGPRLPGTVFCVSAESIVLEGPRSGGMAPNGISYFKVEVYDGPTRRPIAYYKLRVATGLGNFKSADGGFKDTARDFVKDCVAPDARLLAGER